MEKYKIGDNKYEHIEKNDKFFDIHVLDHDTDLLNRQSDFKAYLSSKMKEGFEVGGYLTEYTDKIYTIVSDSIKSKEEFVIQDVVDKIYHKHLFNNEVYNNLTTENLDEKSEVAAFNDDIKFVLLNYITDIVCLNSSLIVKSRLVYPTTK